MALHGETEQGEQALREALLAVLDLQDMLLEVLQGRGIADHEGLDEELALELLAGTHARLDPFTQR